MLPVKIGAHLPGGTLHRIVPSHAKNAASKNAALHLVSIPSTIKVGWGPRFSASITGFADSCIPICFQTSLHILKLASQFYLIITGQSRPNQVRHIYWCKIPIQYVTSQWALPNWFWLDA